LGRRGAVVFSPAAAVEKMLLAAPVLLLSAALAAAAGGDDRDEREQQCYEASVVSFGSNPVLGFLGGTSDFLMAFNPSWVLPSAGTGGRAGLLVRSQNCSADGGLNGSFLSHCGPHCAGGPGSPRGGPGSPSRIAFAELLNDDGCNRTAANGGNEETLSCSTPRFRPIGNASVVFEAQVPSEVRGTEDPRMVFDEHAQVYYLLYTSAYHTHIASSKDPTRADGWTRHGPICRSTTACAKSGALLLSDAPSAENPHHLFHTAGQIFVTHTAGPVTGGNWANSTLFLNGTSWGNPFVESGPPPMKLSTGDYIFFVNSWHVPDPAKGQQANVYEPFWVVLSGSDPTKIIAQASKPLFEPTKEVWMTGHPSTPAAPVVCNTAEVAFVEAAHPIGKDLFRVYFGGADAVVGTAVVQVSVCEDTPPTTSQHE
jgi:predicted GH43/DUF377 family glycosyl hydrolase